MDQSEQKPDPHTLGPSHTHFLFTTGNEFGDETEALFEAADYAVERFNAPVVVVVIGGGGIARRELDYVLRRKWTVVALQDTRKLADQVARLTRPRGIWRGRRQVARASIWIARRLGVLAPEHIDRWVRTRLSTRLREQTVETHAVNGRADELLDMLSWYLDAEPTMVWAWSLFDKLDRAAVVRQKRYFNLLAVSLVLGVASTAAAISTAYERSGTVRDFLNWTLVILPALAAMTTTLVGRLAQDRQWVALRSGSEQIQREIFRYRGGTYANDVKAPTICDAHPHILAQAQRSDLNRIEQNELLAHRLQLVEQALVERLIEVAPFGSSSRTRPSRAPRETFSKSEELRQDVYVKRRLDDQLDYFAKRATKMQRQLTTWIAIPPVLAVGAAILLYKQQSPWTVIIAVGITAVSAWYQTKAIRESLAQGGEAVIKLKRIRGYWLASRQGGLPLAGPNGTAGVATEEMPLSLLVEKTEAVLEREN
ncbi:MAG: hypothetical protein JWM76_1855, partial [Pseudonocardiales bacterium]|nr:hypothetical protein [Pseudonocardiales bacterium]